MSASERPGPRPRRLYVRVARVLLERGGRPPTRAINRFLENLERVGRLVAHGPTSDPPGDLLVLRAEGREEAGRALRSDPYRDREDVQYELFTWDPRTAAPGVNLDPSPPRGSGRLTQVERISVFVRDQAAAIAWYREVLGLTVRSEDPSTGYVEVALGKGAVALSLVEPKAGWGEPYYAEAVARIGKGTGIAFETDSVPALELRLRHAGAVVTQPPEAQPWGGTSLRFADLDGNEFLAFERSRKAAGRAA
ncbi:MAG TPA: VOC family protein [Thermoplasmata archaeon]|nr:VOC family protein [Thermoplasmata archaeon]